MEVFVQNLDAFGRGCLVSVHVCGCGLWGESSHTASVSLVFRVVMFSAAFPSLFRDSPLRLFSLLASIQAPAKPFLVDQDSPSSRGGFPLP